MQEGLYHDDFDGRPHPLEKENAFLRDRHTALVEAARGLLGSLDNGEFKTTITHSVAAEMAEKVYRINRDEVENILRGEEK